MNQKEVSSWFKHHRNCPFCQDSFILSGWYWICQSCGSAFQCVSTSMDDGVKLVNGPTKKTSGVLIPILEEST